MSIICGIVKLGVVLGTGIALQINLVNLEQALAVSRLVK